VSAPALLDRASKVSALAPVVGARRVRVLPVHPELAELFPWGGLRRGSTVSVQGSTTLLLTLLSEATVDGSWAGVVGMPNLGAVAAAELGVELERLVLVPEPGSQLTAVVAALLDGLDLVATTPGDLTDSVARRLSARARHRGAVLISFGPWPGADLELTCERIRWSGLGQGAGVLRNRELVARTRGRGLAARPAKATVLLDDTPRSAPNLFPVDDPLGQSKVLRDGGGLHAV
jgi:hypothetical protein